MRCIAYVFRLNQNKICSLSLHQLKSNKSIDKIKALNWDTERDENGNLAHPAEKALFDKAVKFLTPVSEGLSFQGVFNRRFLAETQRDAKRRKETQSPDNKYLMYCISRCGHC